MRNQCLVVLTFTVLYSGLSAAQDEEMHLMQEVTLEGRRADDMKIVIHNLIALGKHLQKLEDMASYQLQLNMSQQLQELSDRVAAMDDKIEELKSPTGMEDADILKTAIDEGFQTLPKSIMSCSTEDLRHLFESYKDECADGSHNCSPQASCQDSFDGFSCNCLPGYSGDGVTCQDVNECSSDLHDCYDSASCINLDGSYACDCVLPLIGDGYTCTEPRCTDPAQEIEGLGCVLPVNERQSFGKARKTCEKKGGRLLEGITSTDQLRKLDHHFEDFFDYERRGHHDLWIGLRNGRWLVEDTIVNRRFWASQPDAYSPDRKCTIVALQFSPPAYWNAGDCDDLVPFFCQLSVS